MQQILLIAFRIGAGEVLGQPVVMADQLRQQLAAAVQQIAFAGLLSISSARAPMNALSLSGCRAWVMAIPWSWSRFVIMI